MQKLTLTWAAGLSALALVACSGSEKAPAATDIEVVQNDAMATDTLVASEPVGNKTIVELAQGNPQLSTLVTAVTAAGLGETLSGTGPFTVFAPSNDAFAKVDKATLDGLLQPASKGVLLTYHVVAGNVKSGDLAKMIVDGKGTATIKTLNGGNLKASMAGDKIVLTDAKGGKSTVTEADVVASNGTVHVVDTVLMP
ncbi:COG2335 Secreted and surface protein containing fasciclin-like repeats [Sphingomonadaceae bacterium]|nr:fasciclin domain-containing protein [Sphingomonadaceae bacterium]MCF8498694.1 fasciclin domain-containing protein [Sphingomonadaceae bacterium]